MTDEDWDKELRRDHYTSAMQIAASLPVNADAAMLILEMARKFTLDLKHFRETGEYRSAAE